MVEMSWHPFASGRSRKRWRHTHQPAQAPDEESDLAVLSIDATDLVAGEIDGVDGVQPGGFVLAIGDPLGLENSVTFGIISARKVQHGM